MNIIKTAINETDEFKKYMDMTKLFKLLLFSERQILMFVTLSYIMLVYKKLSYKVYYNL